MTDELYKEIAIDPKVMAHWDNFLPVYQEFGFEQGRLLAEFPGDWKKRVMQHAATLVQEGTNTPLSESRMIECMKSEKFKAGLYSCGRQPSQDALTWTESATSQAPPFDLIISSDLKEANDRAIPGEFNFWSNHRFRGTRQCRLPRNSENLIDRAGKLFHKAKQVRFIDRFFNHRSDKANPLIRLIDFLHNNSCPAKVIEIYTEYDPDTSRFQDFERRLDPELPSNMELRFHFLEAIEDGENLHPRFILTDLGGIQYDYGLDEGKGTTIISLLDEDFRQKLWEEYSPNTTIFAHHSTHPTLTIGG